MAALHTRSRRSLTHSVVALLFVLGLMPVMSLTALAAGSAHLGALAVPFAGGKFKLAQSGTQAPPDSLCVALIGVHCYSPQQIRNAYNVTPLLNQGYTGKGQTIVIIDSFGSPTAYSDLQTFDQAYGLPDPPSFKVLSPLGTVPFDPNNGDMLGWAEETSLDVQWAHAMAPGANIVLMTSPVSETEGVQGLPEFQKLEEYALDHHIGKIISQSWGATENTLFTSQGKKVLNSFNEFYERAAHSGVTVFASSGDTGSTNYELDLQTLYSSPVVGFPASSPWVTAVGGTSLEADTNGVYQSETVWNDGYGAGGGGISQYFSEPSYQRSGLNYSDQKQLKGHRGLPDISYNAGVVTGLSVYLGFLGDGNNGFYVGFGGTSAGSPQWAGLTADADQLAHHSLGFINPALYELGNSWKAGKAFHDITVGNNAFNGVPGYNATTGWDLATGWGTPNAAVLLPLLGELTK